MTTETMQTPTILNPNLTREQAEAVAEMNRPATRFVARHDPGAGYVESANWLVRRIDGKDATSAHIFTGKNAKRYAKAFVAMAEAVEDEDDQHGNGATVD